MTAILEGTSTAAARAGCLAFLFIDYRSYHYQSKYRPDNAYNNYVRPHKNASFSDLFVFALSKEHIEHKQKCCYRKFGSDNASLSDKPRSKLIYHK